MKKANGRQIRLLSFGGPHFEKDRYRADKAV